MDVGKAIVAGSNICSNTSTGRTTLMRLVAAAGGFTDIAAINKIKIIRIVDGKEKTFQVNAKDIISGRKKDPVIQSNDLIIVPESFL